MSQRNGPSQRVFVLVALVVAACASACAPSAISARVGSPNFARARELNEAGVDAYAAGHPRDALRYFSEARRLFVEPSLLWNEARCYEQIDDVDEAAKTIGEYLKQSSLHADDRAQGEHELASLRARPSRLSILSTPPGATITVDGQQQWGLLTPTSFGVASGPHAIVVKKDGYQTETRQIQPSFGHSILIEIDLVKAAR